MTEENNLPVQIDPLPAKPAIKKPAFKRVATAEQPKEPSFKRAKTPAEASVAVNEVVPAVIVQEPVKAIAAPANGSYSEIATLISIRDYIHNLINGNYNIEKSKMHDIQKVILLLDRKIVDAILSPEFKLFVNFQDAQSAVNAAARQNNIRTNMYG